MGEPPNNGHNGSPTEPDDPPETGKNGPLQDPETGRFVKGNGGGPGRPKGSADPIKVMRELIKKTGLPLEELAAAVLQSVSNRAVVQGDPACAKLLLDRVMGLQEKGTQVNVGVAVETNQQGPPLPEPEELDERLREIARRVLNGDVDTA